MKQLLFILIAFVATLTTSSANDAKLYENTTWNVIRERLFNGENTRAYRFEDDIRFQVIGAKTYQDSAVFTRMINELNDLFETVQIEMVDTDPNFKLTIEQENGGQSYHCRQIPSGSKIASVNLDLGFQDSLQAKESISRIYYYTIRNLTKLYTPQKGSSNYGGIFDSPDALNATFKDIDKDLIRKLYSLDFYENLKKNTVEKRGYPSYLDLRYKNLFKNLSYFFKAILIIFGFLFLLSKESKRVANPTLWLYIRQRTMILLLAPFIYTFIMAPSVFSPLLIISPGFFIINVSAVVIYALLVLVFLYYTESFFLKRINNFAGKQAFIFFNTVVIVFIIPVVFVSLIFLLTDPTVFIGVNPVSYLTHKPSQAFLIIVAAALRVFYNLINYRIQSMVNQKDVEIAKMKELKNQAELNALHSRINPHFLYNSLNSIASLAHIDADKTENMATGLSDLFRYAINKENKTFVSVAEELAVVKKYLEIEKIRFGDKIVYDIKVDESAWEKQIPKFLIQPLVENAIKHGLSKIKNTGKLLVEVRKVKKDMIISIFDNGSDFPAEPISGYGLQNLHDKLGIIYGDNAIINWENGVNKHFKIVLKNQFEV